MSQSASVHIVCPHCSAVNRVPAARLDSKPGCGQCHQRLFVAQPLGLHSHNFDRHFSHNDLPVLIDFWAPWCGPCRTMAPAFAQAAKQLEPRLRLAKLDTEAEPELGGRFGIRSIPTLALFRQGRELARQSGALSATDIVQWTRAQL